MVLLDIFNAFKGYLFLLQPIVVDDKWDQLNRSFMFILMVVMGGVVTVRQHAGNIIVCEGFAKFGGPFAADYCWTQGLYTVEEAYDKRWQQVPYPGIIPEDVPPCMEVELKNGGTIRCPDEKDIKKPTRKYHTWYQWVPFYFWLSSAAFYLPYILYRAMGFNEVETLVNMCHVVAWDDAEMEKVGKKASTWMYYRFGVYMKNRGGRNGLIARHNLGAITLFTKILYLAMSVLVFWLTAQMLPIGDYISYGEEWTISLPRGQNASTAIRDKLFPKMIACEIKRWGSTGLEQERGMCVIAPNVINQYLFLIEWFSLVFVISCNCFSVIFYAIKWCFRYATYRKLLATAFLQNTKVTRHLYYQIGTTGRIILHVLASNLEPRVFECIVNALAVKLFQEQLLDGFTEKELQDLRLGGVDYPSLGKPEDGRH